MRHIRPAVLAGEWYPGEPSELRKWIRAFLDAVPQADPPRSDLIGLVSPHAGYVYSGFTAAHGYRLLEGRDVEVAAVLSPFHGLPSGDIMVNTASAYETPLGRVPVALDLIDAMRNETEVTDVDAEEEHSIEIQLPFLQTVLKEFRLLPLMIGNRDVRRVESAVLSLLHVLQGKKTILVASTDMHHLDDYESVRKTDGRVTKALESFDIDAIRNVLNPDNCTVCGKVPVSIVLEASTKLGANRFRTLYRSNSRDEFKGRYTGTYTVGYLSAAIERESA
jgi:AmmeMemoRadiSam system protein B